MINPTTRRYARTLRECDPVAYCSSIEHFPSHKLRFSDVALNACYLIAVMVLLASIFVWGQP